MRRFATAGHLASWAGMCPGNHESGGKRRSGRARKGNRALRAALCEAAWSAARSNTGYLSAQYRQLMRTFGKKGQTRAVFAVGHSILVIAWHLLANNCRLRRPRRRTLHPATPIPKPVNATSSANSKPSATR